MFQEGYVWGQTLLCQKVLPQLMVRHSGKLYRKQRNLVTNLFDVDVEPHVEDDATAYKLIWHALVCATVAATANSHKYLQRCLQRLE